ncbi:MAG: CBS domain-containing protein [Dehalococcoidia bacterium]|nr:CBS domain-containing protein [Dehalococcoidia bacterium]
MKLESILATKGQQVFTTRPSTPLSDAVRELAANNIGALIVLDERDQPAGILSERDLIRALAKDPAALQGTVADLMVTDIVTGAPGDDANAVLRTMTNRRFRHLPVIQDGVLAGMITLGDLVKAQLAEMQGTVETLETQLMES